MSDLAKFVAAAIRDKVVLDLQHENAILKKQLYQVQKQLAKVHTVAITGPMCSPIYAQGELDRNGKQVGRYDDCPRWFVDLHQTNNAVIASKEALLGLEVHVGNTGKKAFLPDISDESVDYSYFLEDFDEKARRMDVTLFLGKEPMTFPILHGYLEHVSDAAYRRLLENEKLTDILESEGRKKRSAEKLALVITAVKFNHDLHFGIATRKCALSTSRGAMPLSSLSACLQTTSTNIRCNL
jgi:hypothetical protein